MSFNSVIKLNFKSCFAILCTLNRLIPFSQSIFRNVFYDSGSSPGLKTNSLIVLIFSWLLIFFGLLLLLDISISPVLSIFCKSLSMLNNYFLTLWLQTIQILNLLWSNLFWRFQLLNVFFTNITVSSYFKLNVLSFSRNIIAKFLKSKLNYDFIKVSFFWSTLYFDIVFLHMFDTLKSVWIIIWNYCSRRD